MINLKLAYDYPKTSSNPNMAKCWGCKWEGHVAECETETEQEGWEMPSYTVHLCPKCNEDIEDYFYSEEL